MDYSKLVPSRELCEEMARLGICQDGAELYWRIQSDDIKKYYLSETNYKGIIAPTLPRMMEELPYFSSEVNCKLLSYVTRTTSSWGVVVSDKETARIIHSFCANDHLLPCAVSKALIAIKKGG